MQTSVVVAIQSDKKIFSSLTVSLWGYSCPTVHDKGGLDCEEGVERFKVFYVIRDEFYLPEFNSLMIFLISDGFSIQDSSAKYFEYRNGFGVLRIICFSILWEFRFWSVLNIQSLLNTTPCSTSYTTPGGSGARVYGSNFFIFR